MPDDDENGENEPQEIEGISVRIERIGERSAACGCVVICGAHPENSARSVLAFVARAGWRSRR
jgi:hypothetical protein